MKNREGSFIILSGEIQRIILTIILILGAFVEANANWPAEKVKVTNAPVFSNFFYEGRDSIYIDNILKEDEYYNPILQGCYPDPAICRKGNDY